ncbi:MAG: LD-carboxypeptidase [Flavobacteriaceae bacterium]|nr:LD-carboxypeptidase [Flavobacteriaceae bacterium]
MISPKSLKQNDTVAIVSTARKISLEDIRSAIDWLKIGKLKVKIGKTIGLDDNQFAGSDRERTKDFQNMLDDDEVKAIWCARGGYGTIRIIDALDFSKFKKKPKWIVGYSDVTVLHNHVNNLGYETLHATMPINVAKNSSEALDTLKKVLFGNRLEYAMHPNKFNRSGDARGELFGGNLSILYSLLGSETSLNTRDKILFIEDLDEYLYHVDRMMQNLKRNGYFENLKGLIVGSMSDMNDNTIPFGKTAEQIVFDLCKDYDFPICFNFPAGHINDNRALIMGSNVELKVNNEMCKLRFL